MLWFIIKGVIRDRSRSLFPILVCAFGVLLTFIGACVIGSFEDDLVDNTARFDTGHLKIVSAAYAREVQLRPLEFALETDADFFAKLATILPGYRFTPRAVFGGLLDIPDEKMDTRAQSPVGAMAMDLLSRESTTCRDLKLAGCLAGGRLPARSSEILISKHLAERLSVKPGDQATLFTSTVEGAASSANFIIAGVIRFGIPQLDRATVVLDIQDAGELLDLNGYTVELLGFRTAGFQRRIVEEDTRRFNALWPAGDAADPYRPHALSILDQNNMRTLLQTNDFAMSIIIFIFIFLMALVLWNAGLVSGIRRYAEVGMRLAVGERKSHIVATMLGESLVTGTLGTVLGILLALPFVWWLKEVGLDYSQELKDVSLMMSTHMKAKFYPGAFIVAMVPGILASFTGTLMACVGIWRRETAQLFKELET